MHAGLRSSAMPRRGSTGNMQLTNYSPGSKRKTRQEPAASATEDLWGLDLQFLRSKTSLCAHVRAMRSAQLAEVEKQLSIDAAGHTLQTRKKHFLSFVNLHYEWCVLAFLEYFWNDIASELSDLGKQMHVSCIYNGATITHHPNQNLLDDLPTNLLKMEKGQKITPSQFDSVPSLILTEVPPEAGLYTFTVKTSETISSQVIPYPTLQGAPEATKYQATAELNIQNAQLMENQKKQHEMLEIMRAEINAIRSQPSAETIAMRVVDTAFNEVDLGKRLINPVPRGSEELAKLRSQEIDTENLFILSAEKHQDTGERFNAFDSKSAQDSLRYLTFSKYKTVSDATKKQMASREPKIPPEIASNPGSLSELETHIATSKLAGGAALVKRDEQLKRQQIGQLKIMQPMLRQLSLSGSNWSSIEQALDLLSKFESVSSADTESGNRRNAATAEKIAKLLQVVVERTKETIEVTSDNFNSMAFKTCAAQKQRDEIVHQIQCGSKNAKLEDYTKHTASDWIMSAYPRAEFDGKTLAEIAEVTNKTIAGVQKINVNTRKTNPTTKKKWTAAEWKQWKKNRNNGTEPIPEADDTQTTRAPKGKGNKGGKGKGGGKAKKGKGKSGKGKANTGRQGNYGGEPTAPDQEPAAEGEEQ